MYGPVYRSLTVAALLASVACNQEQKKVEIKMAPPVEYFHVDPATAVKVSGKISYHGAKPSRKVISMDADAKCEAANGNKPVYNQPILTGKGDGLANVFVYVQSGLDGKKFGSVGLVVDCPIVYRFL